MDLILHNQISFDELSEEKFDYFICASGNEVRCTYIAENISLKGIEKFVLLYNENFNEENRLQNLIFFKTHKFKIFEESSNSKKAIFDILTDIKNLCDNKPINILIDYSCMPRTWIAGIFEFLYKYDINTERISIYFTYVPKKINYFIKNVDLISEKLLFEFIHKIKTDLPIALIIGANPYIKNYEKLISSFKPSKTYIFIPEFYYCPDEIINLDTIDLSYKYFNDCIKEKETLFYNIYRINELHAHLNSLVLNLRNKYKVLFIPSGLKPFTLITLILAYQYPDIEIYNCQYQIKEKRDNDRGEPSGLPIVSKVVFVPEYAEDKDF